MTGQIMGEAQGNTSTSMYRRRNNADMQNDGGAYNGKEEEKKRELENNGTKTNSYHEFIIGTSRILRFLVMLTPLVVLIVWVNPRSTLQASNVGVVDKRKELIALPGDGKDQMKNKRPYAILLDANKKKDETNKDKAPKNIVSEDVINRKKIKSEKKNNDRKKIKMVDVIHMEDDKREPPIETSEEGKDRKKKKKTAYDLFMEADRSDSSNALHLSSIHGVDGKHNNQYPSMCSANNNRNIVYSTMRFDRSGSVVQNMLISHAWANENGFAYGGACPSDNITFAERRYGEIEQRMEAHKSMLKAMRLDEIIQIKCPSSPTSINAICNQTDYDFIPPINNMESDSLYTEKYHNELRRIMTHHEDSKERFQQKEQMTVHIRRGDVSPISIKGHAYDKYLPNLYYLRLIQLYNKENKYNVTIHSESESFESFDAFCRLGYTVRLNAPLDEVWKDILTSKVIIMSRGHFSLVPSLLSTALFGSNNVTVVEPPGKSNDPKGMQIKWNKYQNETFMREVIEEKDRLILLNKEDGFASVCPCCEGNLQMEGMEASRSSSAFRINLKEASPQTVGDTPETLTTTKVKQIETDITFNSTNHWWNKYVEEASVIFKPSNNTNWCDMDDTSIRKEISNVKLNENGRKTKSGMYFIKVFKAASSTGAGIALQIAESVFEQKYGSRRSDAVDANDDPNIESLSSYPHTNICPSHVGHGSAYTRRKEPYFLWTVIREPAKRSISYYFFKQVSRRGFMYDSKRLINQLKGDLNFQIDYLDGQQQLQEKKNAKMKFTKNDMGHQNLDEDVNLTETATNMDAIARVRNIMETFHFIAIADRLDESLVVMKMLFGFIEDENTIVLPSKRSGSGGFDEGRFKGDHVCHRLHQPYTTSLVDAYVASSSYQMNNMDYFLYAVVNRSLDKTIDMLGRERVEKEVERHRTLQKVAEDQCSDVAIFPCHDDKMPPDRRSQQSCYNGDIGCGHACVKSVIREYNQNQL